MQKKVDLVFTAHAFVCEITCHVRVHMHTNTQARKHSSFYTFRKSETEMKKITMRSCVDCVVLCNTCLAIYI